MAELHAQEEPEENLLEAGAIIVEVAKAWRCWGVRRNVLMPDKYFGTWTKLSPHQPTSSKPADM